MFGDTSVRDPSSEDIVRSLAHNGGTTAAASVKPTRSRLRMTLWAAASITLIACLLAGIMGCLPIFGQRQPSVPRPTVTPEPESTYTAPATWPPAWTPTATPTSTYTPTPWPTLTVPPSVTPVPGYVSTRPWTSGELTVDYRLNDVWCVSENRYAIEFAVWAEGGNGIYTYYRDIDKIGGPTSEAITYKLTWKDCGGAPGTFFVESGGKRASKHFWVDCPDCCVRQ